MWQWLKNLFMQRTIIPSNHGWDVEVDGNDLYIGGARATAFGGANDPQDDGQTASGYPTHGHPLLLGVALPMRHDGIASLRGSPIPRMPFGIHPDGSDNPDGAHVILHDPVANITSPLIPVIDLGPSLYTGHAVDLTVAAARLFNPIATASNFYRHLDVTIINGAKYI
jgi:hypothetical protein